MRRSSSTITKRRAGSLFITALLTLSLWQVSHWVGFAQGTVPSLLSVAGEIISGSPGTLLWALVNTIWLVLKSVLLGLVIGSLLGLSIGITNGYLSGLYYIASALKGTPVTILIPVFLSVFGLQGFLVPILTLPVIVHVTTNVAAGVLSVNSRRKDIMDLLSISQWDYIRHILVFEIIEGTVDTLRVVIPLTLAIEVALDYFLSINSGIGALISHSYDLHNYQLMYAGIILIGFMGIFLVSAIDYIASVVTYWRH